MSQTDDLTMEPWQLGLTLLLDDRGRADVVWRCATSKHRCSEFKCRLRLQVSNKELLAVRRSSLVQHCTWRCPKFCGEGRIREGYIDANCDEMRLCLGSLHDASVLATLKIKIPLPHRTKDGCTLKRCSKLLT